MSVFSHLITNIVDVVQLKRALNDLEAQLEKNTDIITSDGKTQNVDIVVLDPNGKKIGFKKTESGEYQAVSDACGLNKEQIKKQQDFIKKIRQRYSYNKVIDELKKQGYLITQEEKVQDNTIKIVARKWS